MYVVSPQVLRAELDGELVLLNPEIGMYHLVNATGARVIEGFDDGLDTLAIGERIADKTSGDRTRVVADVDSFVATMLSKGLLQPVGE